MISRRKYYIPRKNIENRSNDSNFSYFGLLFLELFKLNSLGYKK
ncbi:MAG: hypothetical protein AABW83_04475 [Nanoarchaeota archaeon]